MSHQIQANTPICGVILAGGQGTRMALRDKGLVRLNDRSLIGHVIYRIQPQVDRIVINCNRHLEIYQEFGFTLVTDAIQDFNGPLRGILSAREPVGEDLCLVVPCDMPYLPLDLVQRLKQDLQHYEAAYVVAKGQVQPLVLLLKPRIIARIEPYLGAGGRSVKGWLKTLNAVAVSFDASTDGFDNINNFEQLATAAALMFR